MKVGLKCKCAKNLKFGQFNMTLSMQSFYKLWVFLVVLIFSVTIESQAQVVSLANQNNEDAEFWADSVYQSLSLEERVGQLIFIRANHSGQDYIKDVGQFIRDYNLGGVVFFAGDPLKQALTCHLLYISTSKSTELASILNGLKARPMITVGDSKKFAAHGGGIQFITIRGRLRFIINLDAAKTNQIQIS